MVVGMEKLAGNPRRPGWNVEYNILVAANRKTIGSLELETGIILLPGKITRKSCLLRAKKPTEFTDEYPLRFNSLRFTLTSLSPGCPLSVSSRLLTYFSSYASPLPRMEKRFAFQEFASQPRRISTGGSRALTHAISTCDSGESECGRYCYRSLDPQPPYELEKG